MMSIRVLLTVVCACNWLSLCALAQDHATTSTTTNWSFDDLIAALQWREERLSACSVSFRQREFIGEPMNRRPPTECYRTDATIRFGKGVTNVDSVVEYLSWNPRVVLKSRERWDGQIVKTLSYRRTGSQKGESVEALVNAQKPELLVHSEALDLFGARGQMYSSERLLSRVREGHPSIDITTSTRNGDEAIVVAGRKPKEGSPNEWELVFLPQKDFVLISAHTYGYTAHNFKSRNYERVDTVTELKQSDGLWVVARGSVEVQLLTSSGVDQTNRMDIEFTEVSLRTPTDAELTIPEPPAGAVVVDSVARQAYRILPDGTKRYETLIDSATGQTIGPSTTPSAR